MPTEGGKLESVTLVGVSLVSVLALAAVNYVVARVLIDDSVQDQLVAVRESRIQALEVGADRIQARVSNLATNPSVVEALADLAAEFRELDEDITPEEADGLAAIYDAEVLPPFVAAGLDVDASGLVPSSAAGRYLQQQYIAQNPDGFDERDLLDDAGDGSRYSAAHAKHHPLLRALKENALMSDLLLVDADTGDVVYSTMKRIDFGTNAFTGPHSLNRRGERAALGAVTDRLSSVAVGEAVLADTVFYVPTAGDPVLFLAAAVRSGSDVLGAVVTEVPVDALTAIMTANEDWELLGLGETGESFIVGPDQTLRSNSRAWIEDPDDYLRRYVDRYGDEAGADLIETVGSPVLLQRVENASVNAGLEGDEYIGNVTNYLGTKTLAASAPAQVDGLDWAVVVEFDRSETNTALNSLLRRILLVLAVLLPTIAVVGMLLSRILTRPAERLVKSAARIADGDLDTGVEDLGRNELGDLGRQLDGVARQLESGAQAIVDQEQDIIDLLTALLPARLVDRVRQGEAAIDDILDTATVVSITVDGMPEAVGADQDLAIEITARLDEEMQTLMSRYDIERIQRSPGRQLYLSGLGHDDARATDAVTFSVAARDMVVELGAEFGQALTARAGMASGDVATGVLGTSQLSFGVWGDPPGMAVTLVSHAQPGQVLADRSVVEQLGSDWDLGPLQEFSTLADDIDAQIVNGRVAAPSDS